MTTGATASVSGFYHSPSISSAAQSCPEVVDDDLSRLGQVLGMQGHETGSAVRALAVSYLTAEVPAVPGLDGQGRLVVAGANRQIPL